MSDAAAPQTDAPEALHPYTLETLKAHGTREDLWMLLHGKVYNVTKFLDEVSPRKGSGHLDVRSLKMGLFG